MSGRQSAINFCVPSLADKTLLDGRIYHPQNLLQPVPGYSHLRYYAGPGAVWRKRGAIIAHPYAPLGGTYDDHVVMAVTEKLLSLGYVVVTFNFRGARGSHGKTSWTGKAEVADYSTMVGFLVTYLESLRLPPHNRISHVVRSAASPKPVKLVLAGYSYGALVAMHLPPVPEIMAEFSNCVAGPTATEVVLRAHSVAEISSSELLDRTPSYLLSLGTLPSLIGQPRGGINDNTRVSHKRRQKSARGQLTRRHSFDVYRFGASVVSITRKSKDRLIHSIPSWSPYKTMISAPGISKSQSHTINNHNAPGPLYNQSRFSDTRVSPIKRSSSAPGLTLSRTPTAATATTTTTTTGSFATASSSINLLSNLPLSESYLLISPILPPLSTLTAFSLRVSPSLIPKLAHHPTLAVAGSRDVFCSLRKLQGWVHSMARKPAARFRFVCIAEATHFWDGEEQGRALVTAVGTWVADADG